ncbi:unnamed protein product, partial [Rotaria sordida]
FQLIGIDYCDPFKPTSRGNQYVLCITDYFTKWMTAIALPDCSVQTTAQTLFNNYICQYDVPLAILSDQGTHFKNQLMESIAKLIGYNHIFSSVYHPQNLENNNWDEFLSPVVFAYNTNIHATTNYSPFQLQFGRESRLPTDEPLSSFTFNKPNDYNVQLKKNLLIIQQHAHAFDIPTSLYEIICAKKYTTTETMQKLIDHVRNCNEFTFVSEGEKSAKQLALIQIQTIPQQLPFFIILVELAHLPPINSLIHLQIK